MLYLFFIESWCEGIWNILILKWFVLVFYWVVSCFKFGYVIFGLFFEVLMIWIGFLFSNNYCKFGYVIFGLIWYDGMFVLGEINVFRFLVVWMGKICDWNK